MNMRWNHRGAGTGCNATHDAFDGILLQEWDEKQGLIGPVRNIYAGTERGLTEAPHIFQRNGYYYLTTAEGGTTYDHAVTLSRSKTIWGPYEDHPNTHVMTTRDAPDHPIQRTGHGQYVESADGAAWHTFLMGRPLTVDGTRNCPMGRETGIAKCKWVDDWLYLDGDGLLPPETIDGPDQQPRLPTVHSRFEMLPAEFQWLRTPFPDRLFGFQDGELILKGRESIGSWFEQSLVARRQEDFAYKASTTLVFEPETYQQGAGLTTYYDRHRFHAALITQEQGQRVLILMSCNADWPDGSLDFPLSEPVFLPNGPITLEVEVDHKMQQFYWSAGGQRKALGPPRKAYLISDEGGRGPEHSSFTGAFVGMVCYDITGQAKEARFSQFSYYPG